MAKITTIGSLETGAYHPVYRRGDGTTWIKLNDTEHQPAKRSRGDWVAGGDAKRFHAHEEVTVLHEAHEEVA